MSFFKKFSGLMLLFLGLGLASCAPRFSESQTRRSPEAARTRKAGSYFFLAESRSVSLMVDVELARMRRTENYLPLVIMLANKDLYELSLDRDSLLLLDPNEDAYLMPGFQEINTSYDKFSFDARYYAFQAAAGNDALTSFSFFRKERCSFYPHPYKDSILQDALVESVHLPQKSFIKDLIYFPMPKTGVSGQRFRLRLLSPELEVPFEMEFFID